MWFSTTSVKYTLCQFVVSIMHDINHLNLLMHLKCLVVNHMLNVSTTNLYLGPPLLLGSISKNT